MVTILTWKTLPYTVVTGRLSYMIHLSASPFTFVALALLAAGTSILALLKAGYGSNGSLIM